MAIARPVPKSAEQSPAKLDYLGGLRSSSVHRQAQLPERFWLFCVAMLSLASLIFGIISIVLLSGDQLLDAGSAWALAFTGFFGTLTTLAAFVVTIASLRARITRKTRLVLWTLVVSSLACWLYFWISFSAVCQVPPHVPMKM